MQKNSVGRPIKMEKHLNKIVSTRMTIDEYCQLEMMLEEFNLNKGDFLREAIMFYSKALRAETR